MSDTIARRRLTTLDKLTIVLRQARCPMCGEKLGELAGLDFDHMHALALGGADTLDNVRAIHKTPCHSKKTNGSKATTAGSDKNRIAKVTRITEAQAEARRRMLAKQAPDLTQDGEMSAALATCRTKSWPKQKLRSRGFEKRRSR